MSTFSACNQWEIVGDVEMKRTAVGETASCVDCGRICPNDDPIQTNAITNHDDADAKNTVICNDDAVESTIKFSPPLYKQRYERVCSILRQAEVTSICDYGCAECRAIWVFRSIDTVEHLVGVDIDRKLLVDHCRRLDPLICDFLFRRCRPLHIDLFHGSLLDYDHRLKGIDAVTLIEVIEHLYEADLALLPAALFGKVAPRVIVITTPNADFNVLFPSLVGFRHPDHKFEWTRSQFEEWCNLVATEYSYSVVFGGVGDPPEHHAAVGHCSQYAVFTRQETRRTEMTIDDSMSTPYDSVHVAEYPAVEKPSSIEEAVLIEAQYYINLLVRFHQCRDGGNDNTEDDVCDRDGVILIDLSKLMTFPKLRKTCNDDVDFLRRVLASANFTISDDGCHVHYRILSRSCSEVGSDNEDDYLLNIVQANDVVTERPPAECWD